MKTLNLVALSFILPVAVFGQTESSNTPPDTIESVIADIGKLNGDSHVDLKGVDTYGRFLRPLFYNLNRVLAGKSKQDVGVQLEPLVDLLAFSLGQHLYTQQTQRRILKPSQACHSAGWIITQHPWLIHFEKIENALLLNLSPNEGGVFADAETLNRDQLRVKALSVLREVRKSTHLPPLLEQRFLELAKPLSAGEPQFHGFTPSISDSFLVSPVLNPQSLSQPAELVLGGIVKVEGELNAEWSLPATQQPGIEQKYRKRLSVKELCSRALSSATKWMRSSR